MFRVHRAHKDSVTISLARHTTPAGIAASPESLLIQPSASNHVVPVLPPTQKLPAPEVAATPQELAIPAFVAASSSAELPANFTTGMDFPTDADLLALFVDPNPMSVEDAADMMLTFDDLLRDL